MEGYISPHPATAFPETPVTLREIGQEVADLWQRALDVDLVPWAKLVGLPGRTGIRSRTGKPRYPAFPVSGPLLFQSSSFEDIPRISLPCIVFLRELSRLSASAGQRTDRTEAAGS